MFPPRLQKGDLIRVLSPSSSMTRVGGLAGNQKSYDYLVAMGYRVSFSENINCHDILGSASIAARVADLHAAFLDEEVHCILTTIGGFNANELLPYLDYELIAQHPKIICGYSDTTALLNSIYAKTGLVTYSGAAYSSFKMAELQKYQSSMWQQALTTQEFTLTASDKWSDDLWFDPSVPRNLKENTWQVYTAGRATGTALCGNLSTFGLLQGTEFCPQVQQPLLFVESAEEDNYQDFNRDLASLLQIYPEPKGVVIGRFPAVCNMSEEFLLYILDKFPILKKIPVLYDVNFGHTQPIFTFPIGGKVTMDTTQRTLFCQQ